MQEPDCTVHVPCAYTQLPGRGWNVILGLAAQYLSPVHHQGRVRGPPELLFAQGMHIRGPCDERPIADHAVQPAHVLCFRRAPRAAPRTKNESGLPPIAAAGTAGAAGACRGGGREGTHA